MDRRRVLVVAALAGAFIGGCVVGATFVFLRTVVPMGQILALSSLGQTGSKAYVKYRYASYPVAKAALLNYAKEVAAQPVREGMLGESLSAYDLGLTYGRLAIAAERAGEAADVAQYMARSKEAFAKGGRQIGESQVREWIERLDAGWDQGLAELGKQPE